MWGVNEASGRLGPVQAPTYVWTQHSNEGLFQHEGMITGDVYHLQPACQQGRPTQGPAGILHGLKASAKKDGLPRVHSWDVSAPCLEARHPRLIPCLRYQVLLVP